MKKIILNVIFGFVAIFILGSCISTSPYIYKESEFDRNAPAFGKKLMDREEVHICYNTSSTSASAIRQLAEKECGRFSKFARFKESKILVCPLLTPAKASFSCIN
ncbi:MAG: hypothetical protein VX617_04805 [Pseudomonadota bacterium]|nr:hypothetical protein [Pseudomonadota bacterium]